MEYNQEVSVLKIYIGSTDQINQQPLYEYLVFQAKKKGISGATVTKGIMGFGASSVIHSYKFWEISEKVPLVVKFVDEDYKIREFWQEIQEELENIRYGCLATIGKADLVLYRSGAKHLAE